MVFRAFVFLAAIQVSHLAPAWANSDEDFADFNGIQVTEANMAHYVKVMLNGRLKRRFLNSDNKYVDLGGEGYTLVNDSIAITPINQPIGWGKTEIYRAEFQYKFQDPATGLTNIQDAMVYLTLSDVEYSSRTDCGGFGLARCQPTCRFHNNSQIAAKWDPSVGVTACLAMHKNAKLDPIDSITSLLIPGTAEPMRGAHLDETVLSAQAAVR